MEQHDRSVSVVMPAYCAERTIKRAITSVLLQSHCQLELIVIDDASTDDTFSIVQECAMQDSRIHILHNKKNLGVSLSRQKGILAAKYKLIAFLDSDDVWEPNKLAQQIDVLVNDPDCALCFTSSQFINEIGQRSEYILHAPAKVTYKDLLKQNVVSCSSVLVRREDLLKTPMPDFPMIHEDYAVWLNLLQKYPYARGIDKPLLTYQISSTSKSGQKMKAAKMQWNTYRYCQLPFFKAGFSFFSYAFRNLKKYAEIKRQMKRQVNVAGKVNIKEQQAVLLEMLREIDRICKKHEIPYMLFSGTALGAVRNQGFIPWDDDLDIIMLRPAYEQFLRIAPKEIDAGQYYVQKEFSSHWPMFFSKLRKNNTTCLERYVPRDPKMHQGVYIDIFPCDNLSDNQIMRRLQFMASKVVIAKSLNRRGYLTHSLKKKVVILFCHLLPQKSFLRLAQLQNHNQTQMVHCFFGGNSKYEKSVFPREWFTQKTDMTFEGETFPVSAQYDELLTTLYGDYRTPTPENERGIKVHAEFVDLEHSYQKYEGVQKTMGFQELTRSIR